MEPVQNQSQVGVIGLGVATAVAGITTLFVLHRYRPELFESSKWAIGGATVVVSGAFVAYGLSRSPKSTPQVEIIGPPEKWSPAQQSLAAHAKKIRARFYPLTKSHHGILHTSRASLFGLASVRLFEKYNRDFKIEGISREKFEEGVQLALFLHDSARKKDDGPDLWDCESALNIYRYLIDEAGFDKKMARCIAEAAANKDYFSDTNTTWEWDELDITGSEPRWIKRTGFTPHDQLQLWFLEAIQFGDCLDVKRVRTSFAPKYISFYRIAEHNADAMAEFNKLAAEADKLIDRSGSHKHRRNAALRQRFLGQEDIYGAICSDIVSSGEFPTLTSLTHLS